MLVIIFFSAKQTLEKEDILEWTFQFVVVNSGFQIFAEAIN